MKKLLVVLAVIFASLVFAMPATAQNFKWAGPFPVAQPGSFPGSVVTHTGALANGTFSVIAKMSLSNKGNVRESEGKCDLVQLNPDGTVAGVATLDSSFVTLNAASVGSDTATVSLSAVVIINGVPNDLAVACYGKGPATQFSNVVISVYSLQGPAGQPGNTPQIAVNTTTGLPGSQASVILDPSSTVTNPIFNFSIPQGAMGPTGFPGAPGAAGVAGAQGPIGLTGAVGPVGATGSQGATGAVGPVGLTGAQGAVGPAGANGAVGLQGPIGLTGPAGAPGVNGATGAIGSVGPAGATGPAGANGLNGAQGVPGPAGMNGLDATPAFMGAWNPNTNYTQGQLVLYCPTPNGAMNLYLNVSGQDPVGINPATDTTNWYQVTGVGGTASTSAASTFSAPPPPPPPPPGALVGQGSITLSSADMVALGNVISEWSCFSAVGNSSATNCDNGGGQQVVNVRTTAPATHTYGAVTLTLSAPVAAPVTGNYSDVEFYFEDLTTQQAGICYLLTGNTTVTCSGFTAIPVTAGDSLVIMTRFRYWNVGFSGTISWSID